MARVPVGSSDSYAGDLLPAERRASITSVGTHSSSDQTERGSATPIQEQPQSELRQRLAEISKAGAFGDQSSVDHPFGEAKKKLRIGFIHPDLGIGGAERLVVDAALALQARGHDVSIFTSHHDPKHCFEPTRDGTLKVYHMRTKIPRSLPRLHAFHLPFAIMQQISLVVQLLIALALTRFSWLQTVPFLAHATSIRRETAAQRAEGSDTPATTPPLPLPPFDLFIFDQLSVGIPLLRLGSGTRVAYYCHFPDKEIARALDRQARTNAHTIKQKVVTAVKIALKSVYRIPFDLLEEITTDAADRIMVNSHYTAAWFLHSFPIISARLTREAQARGQAQAVPGIGTAPKVVYPAVDTTEFTTQWVATELSRLEETDKKAKERATSAATAAAGTMSLKLKAKYAKEGSRGLLEVRRTIRELCINKERPTFVSINRFEAKKNIALAVSAFAELVRPELEATKEAVDQARSSNQMMNAATGARPTNSNVGSPRSLSPAASDRHGTAPNDEASNAPLRIDMSTLHRPGQVLPQSDFASRRSSTSSFARFAQMNQMTRSVRSLRAAGGLRLVVSGGYDYRVWDNISTLQALQAQCDELGLRHITLSYNAQPFEPPISPPAYEDVSSAHVIFLQSAPVGCLRALLTNESTVGLVYTPAGEHFGIVPLEAAACGLPVLAVNDGGPRESVVDGGVTSEQVGKSSSSSTIPASNSGSTVRSNRGARQAESRPGTAKADDSTPRGSMTDSRPKFNIGDEDALSNIQPPKVNDSEEDQDPANDTAAGPSSQPRRTTPLFDDKQRRKLLLSCLKRGEGAPAERWTNEDGTGLLRSNQVDAFLDGMRTLLGLWMGQDETKARSRVAAAAKRRVSEHFGLEVLSQRLEEVALECVNLGKVEPLQIVAPLLGILILLFTVPLVFYLLQQNTRKVAQQAAEKATAAVRSTQAEPITSKIRDAAQNVVTAATAAITSASSAASEAATAAASAVHAEL
ncbi:Alpha-1,3-mannosyltransferase-like protein [Tilletia horrida]|uniref:Asparagine-linked glycosylation protein 2 n=1 Tax=Tilletia horrida TaxID=155126 RepID=A0AAN6GU67_9BASI|nr:Alpha-1,3-mannosyltransferase-like protein [Tilletia horrida]KAK0554108.1 Alpha-1,3-mannosyltransferase-like protein [Tilletia horrida]